jgi:hypothetical protein
MRIYLGFVDALDAGGEKISGRLSEVDLSDPEDVRAIFSDGGAGAEVLVHFGDSRFLERYRQYEQHLAEWKTQYPRLASVDMRYERQVVLEMRPGGASGHGDGLAGDEVAADARPAAVSAAGKAAVAKTAAVKAKISPTPVSAGGKASVSAGSSAAVSGPRDGLHPTHGDKTAMDGAHGLLVPSSGSQVGKAVPVAPVGATGKAAAAPVGLVGKTAPVAAQGPVQHLTTAFSVPSTLGKNAAGAAKVPAVAGKAAGSVAAPGVPQ